MHQSQSSLNDGTDILASDFCSNAGLRSHSDEEWQRIRPLIAKMYVQDDMRLRDIMIELRREHGFVATESMFKKRMRAWGFLKAFKANAKTTVVKDMLESSNASLAKLECIVQRRKVRRHALKMLKDGALDQDQYARLFANAGIPPSKVKPGTNVAAVKSTRVLLRKHIQPSPLLHVFTPSTAMLNKERLFVALRALVVPGDTGKRSNHGLDIAVCIDAGFSKIKLGAYQKARISFYTAGRMLLIYLRQGTIPFVTLIYYLNPAVWAGRQQRRYYSSFVNFVRQAISQECGPNHPLESLACSLGTVEPDSVDTALRMWDCIMDNIQLSTQTVRIWYEAAKKRIEHQVEIGMYDAAQMSYKEVICMLKQHNLLTDARAIALRYEMARAFVLQRALGRALLAFQEVITLGTVDICDHRQDYYVIAAMYQIARILEFGFDDIVGARQYYVDALRTSIFYCGPRFSETLDIFAELLGFCEFHGFGISEVISREEYSQCYEYLVRYDDEGCRITG